MMFFRKNVFCIFFFLMPCVSATQEAADETTSVMVRELEYLPPVVA